jgi:hypothetical protein
MRIRSSARIELKVDDAVRQQASKAISVAMG